MAHVREQIRKALATAVTGLTTAGANVTTSRVHPYLEEDATLPGYAVFTNDEETEEPGEEVEIGTQNRVIIATVAAYADGTLSNVEDTLDDMLSEAETAIYVDESLGGLVKQIDVAKISTDFQAGASKVIGVAELQLMVHYMTRIGAPETAI